MKNLFLLILSVISVQQAFAQNFAWVQHWGGQYLISGLSTTTDGNGNIFVTGTFEDTMDADPGPAVFNLVSAGARDTYISKFNASGTLLWAKQFSGTSDANVVKIATDQTGNVYVAGTYSQATDFDPGPGIYNLQYSNARNSYICKLDNAGNFIWAKGFIGDMSEISDIVIDASQSVYATGTLYSLTDFDPGTGVYNMDAHDAPDLFVCKLDADGAFVWAKQIAENGDTSDVSATSIALDLHGNVYLTGHFNGTADFDPGTGTFNLTSSGPQFSKDVFVCKLDGTGNFIWAGSFTGSLNEEIGNILVDEDDNAYLAGHFWGTVDFDPGPGTFEITASAATGANAFFCKLDENGNFVWAKSFAGGNIYPRGSVITEDHIYTTGHFRGTIDFDPGSATQMITTTGDWDVFVSKLDLNGNLVWAHKFGDVVSEDGTAITVDQATGNVFIIGHFTQPTDMDPSPETWKMVSEGAADVFLLKLSECVPNNGITQGKESCTQYLWPENGGLYTTSGSYWHILTSSTGCDSTVKLNLVLANADFVAEISMNGQYLNVNTSASVDQYKWINCATFAVVGTEENYLLTANGSYAVITTAGDCIDTSECFQVTNFSVGLDELEAAGFSLYPNPVSDHLVFQSSNALQPFEIEITSVNGQLTDKGTFFSGDKITTEKWRAGIYLVKIISDEKSYVTRIVKN